MAENGSKTRDLNSWLTLQLDWKCNSQSVENNTSSVTATLSLTVKGSGKLSIGERTVSLVIDGKTYLASKKLTITGENTVTLISKTVNISHDSDGSKSCLISATLAFDATISGEWWGDRAINTSATLGTIPRASTLTAENGTLGVEQILKIERKSTKFTHTIKYECGSASKTVCTKSESTSIKWTPPLDLAKQNTTGTKVAVKFTITTHSSDKKIGTKYLTVNCAIPPSVVPKVTAQISESTDYKNKYGCFLKDYSKFNLTLNFERSYDSNIVSVAIKAFSKTQADSNIAATVNSKIYDLGKSSTSGTLKINVTIRDARGRKATTSLSVAVEDYSLPKISTFTVGRCDENGNADNKGEYALINYAASIWNDSNKANEGSFEIRYKESAVSKYTTKKLTAAQSASGTFKFAADTNKSYEVVLAVKDSIYAKEVTKTTSVSTAFTIMNISQSGKSVAFGKVAESEEAFELGIPLKMFKANTLSSGTDLDDLKTFGSFVSETTAGDTTTLNYPNSPFNNKQTFLVEVLPGAKEDVFVQRLTICSKTSSEIYERHFYNDSWGDWYVLSSILKESWKALTLNSDVVEVIPVKYCLRQNVVHLTGRVKLTTDSNGAATIATLPEGYRPASGAVYKIVAVVGKSLARVLIGTDGVIKLEFVHSIYYNKTLINEEISWIDLNLCFAL